MKPTCWHHGYFVDRDKKSTVICITKCELSIATILPHTHEYDTKQIREGTNQQGSIFPDQANILNYIQIIFTTNHKQNSVYNENKQTSVHIQ